MIKCLQHCENAVYSSELEDLIVMPLAFGEEVVPLTLLDAMRFRLSTRKGLLLHIEHAANGSIILGGIVAAGALWVLENTLGETLKDAWKESETHKKVLALLTKRFEHKHGKIGEQIKQSIEKDDDLSLNVEYVITKEEEAVQAVFIHIIPKYPEGPFPERSEYLQGTSGTKGQTEGKGGT
jgi:hypothetical protein